MSVPLPIAAKIVIGRWLFRAEIMSEKFHNTLSSITIFQPCVAGLQHHFATQPAIVPTLNFGIGALAPLRPGPTLN